MKSSPCGLVFNRQCGPGLLAFALAASALLAPAGCADKPAGAPAGTQEKQTDGAETPEPAPARKPGPPACSSCHESQCRLWAYGGHVEVECAACHGEPGRHVLEDADPRPRMKTGGRELCMDCHDLAGEKDGKDLTPDERTENHMLFLEKKHVIRINRLKVGGRCIHCHDPHLGR